MSVERLFQKSWRQLAAKHPHYKSFLNSATIKGLRGIKDLRVDFQYPVTAIAGPNACGKSTVLFALACAYRVPESGPRDFIPSTLFPDFIPKKGDSRDNRPPVSLEYEYKRPDQVGLAMRWQRSRSGRWGRSFFGRKDAKQPENPVYLRTLSSISNPSEVRSYLSMAAKPNINELDIDIELIRFAERILPFQYQKMVKISRDSRGEGLLFASRQQGDGGADYSEFHMSAGERAVLHMSMAISNMSKALILIDEVEAGLHPYTQEKLMLELQRIALRNESQIVVTTHSPVVLDTVPPEARVFLERDGQDVARREPHRDIILNAMYGRSRDVLRILCEDSVAEGILLGLFDHLVPKLNMHPTDIAISRDTGKDEFKKHYETLSMVGMADNFLFVLDGDARDDTASLRQKIEDRGGSLLYLPGDTPERWIWDTLKQDIDAYAKELGMVPDNMRRTMSDKEQLFSSASDTDGNKAKGQLDSFAEESRRGTQEIARTVAHYLAGSASEGGQDFREFAQDMEDAVNAWRDRVR